MKTYTVWRRDQYGSMVLLNVVRAVSLYEVAAKVAKGDIEVVDGDSPRSLTFDVVYKDGERNRFVVEEKEERR